MDPSVVPAVALSGGRHHYIWPPTIKKRRVFPVVSSGGSSSSSSVAPAGPLALCDKQIVFSEIADEGAGVLGDEIDKGKSDLDNALEQLAAFVDDKSSQPASGDGGVEAPPAETDAFEGGPNGTLFAPPLAKHFYGRLPATVVGIFPNGRIAYYLTDERFEATCFLHPGCVLTRAARKKPLAFLHWWLAQGSNDGCSTKQIHWSASCMNPDENMIKDWGKSQFATGNHDYIDLNLAQMHI
jgi:hypothetical protein